jgi:hypothetical protein
MKKTVVITAFMLTACQQAAETHMMVFMEQEEGIEPYQTRVLVNTQFLRFDDGDGAHNYMLMDRQTKKIYNVNNQDKTVMVLERKNHAVKPPFELKNEVKKIDDMQGAPAIHGKQPAHYQLSTNNQVCLDVVSVDGLLPEAVSALREYHAILASDSATTLVNIPADMQEPCMLSMSTFSSDAYLQHGFPVHEWKPGYQRHLVDYKKTFDAPPEIFMLPQEYFQFTVQQMREGKVDFQARVLQDAATK